MSNNSAAARHSQPSSSPKKLSAVPPPAPKPKEPEPPLQLPVQQDERALHIDLWGHVLHALGLAGVEHAKQKKWSPMFIFVRELMRFNLPPNLRDDPDAMATLLERLHREWRNWLPRQEQDKIAPDFWDDNAARLKGGQEEFVCVWSCMEYQPGADPLLAAYALARTDPMMKPMPGKSGEYIDLLVTAKQLQMIIGHRNIVLPQERLASILCISQMTVSRYVTLAIREGYLRLVRTCDRAAKRAAEYRYVFEREKRPGAKFTATGAKNVN